MAWIEDSYQVNWSLLVGSRYGPSFPVVDRISTELGRVNCAMEQRALDPYAFLVDDGIALHLGLRVQLKIFGQIGRRFVGHSDL